MYFTIGKRNLLRVGPSQMWVVSQAVSTLPYLDQEALDSHRSQPLDHLAGVVVVRPACREDLLSIGEAVVMTERSVISVLQYDAERRRSSSIPDIS